jgi:2-iminobutanoate/2-iminopropanoate deaminase
MRSVSSNVVFMQPRDNPLDFGAEMFEGTNPFAEILPRRPAKPVLSPKAPAPIGPYSQAIVAGNTIYCSGQLGLDPATMQLADGVAAQTQRALQNLAAVLEAGRSTTRLIVKTTIYLVDMNDFATVNAVYATFFPHRPPARTTIAVAALPLGGRVEIEAIALIR